MSILVCSLCKNEMGRYLKDVVPIWEDFADDILVLDDGSTDGSFEWLAERGHDVRPHEGDPMMGAEHDIRQALWDAACATKHDWLLWLDTDMYPASNPRRHMEAAQEGGLLTLLWYYVDLWGDGVYREDDWWQAHLNPRPWAVINPGPNDYSVLRRGWHSGHIPSAAWRQPGGIMPPQFSLMHLAYATEQGRLRQFEKYAKLNNMGALKPNEWVHAETIIDEDPEVFPLTFTPEYHVTP